MGAAACAEHPQAAAGYRCDGCERLLCTECIQEGHALLFCKVCGERAMPLGGGSARPQPATVRERRRHQAVTRPYSLGQALAYPFRGLGLFLFIAALVCTAVVSLVAKLSLTGGAIAGGYAALLTGLQFKIVRSSAEGDDELPDWPDFIDVGERIRDALAVLVISLLQFGPAALYAWLGRDSLLSLAPSLPFWAGFVVVAWLGAAVGVMAFGAAGRFSRAHALRVDLHVRGFLSGGADAVTVANLTFGLGLLFFLVRSALAAIPLAGTVAGAVVGTYWLFTSAHLAGVLFRRHIYELERLYP